MNQENLSNMSYADSSQFYPPGPISRSRRISSHILDETPDIHGMRKYVKVKFTSKDTLFQSYNIFRQQCQPYNIYISDITQITHDEMSMCPTQVNGKPVSTTYKNDNSKLIYSYLFDENNV